MTSINSVRTQLEQRKGRRDWITSDLENTKTKVRDAKRQIVYHEKALEIVKQVGLKTQQELEYHISNLVSAAISSVFPSSNYEFKVKFIERRGRTECDLLLIKDGEEIDPMSAVGGGLVDVISFALRVAFLSMEKDRVTPLLLLDEPFKHLSTDLQDQVGIMLKEISSKIGIQTIYISHAEEAVEGADKVFHITYEDNKSRIEEKDT